MHLIHILHIYLQELDVWSEVSTVQSTELKLVHGQVQRPAVPETHNLMTDRFKKVISMCALL